MLSEVDGGPTDSDDQVIASDIVSTGLGEYPTPESAVLEDRIGDIRPIRKRACIERDGRVFIDP